MTTRVEYVDYHNHTTLCRHATGEVDEYLARANDLGFREFGFAEHSYWMMQLGQRRLCPTQEELATYHKWMDERRNRWDGRDGGMVLRVGLEADWLPSREAEARAFLASYPYDYVLGSVHHFIDPCTKGWVVTWNFEGKNLDAVYKAYFEEVARLAESGMCDILGHLDVIRRAGRIPNRGVVPYVEAILPRLKASGVAVEINASGKDHTGEDFFPCRGVLSMLVGAGIPITFGSDGHKPEHVGRYWRNVVAALREAGGTSYVRFEGRRAIVTPLGDATADRA